MLQMPWSIYLILTFLMPAPKPAWNAGLQWSLGGRGVDGAEPRAPGSRGVDSWELIHERWEAIGSQISVSQGSKPPPYLSICLYYTRIHIHIHTLSLSPLSYQISLTKHKLKKQFLKIARQWLQIIETQVWSPESWTLCKCTNHLPMKVAQQAGERINR